MNDESAHAGRAEWQIDRAGTISRRSLNERLLALGYTQQQLAAIDIMTDDDVPLKDAGEFALAATKNGDNAEEFARHFVKLRKVVRGEVTG